MELRAAPLKAEPFRSAGPCGYKAAASVPRLHARQSPPTSVSGLGTKRRVASLPRLRSTGLVLFFRNQDRDRAVLFTEVFPCDPNEVEGCYLLVLVAGIEKLSIIAQGNLVVP